MFSLDAKEFLLGGPLTRPNEDGNIPPDGAVPKNAVKEIESYSQSLLNESETFLNQETKIAESFDSILTKVLAYRSQIDDPDLLVKIQHYSSAQSQIQLLTLAKALNDLQKFTNVRDIPKLVHDLMSTLPKHLQSSCKIHKNIITTVTNMKTYLLKKFHEDFNAHLESNEDSNDAKQMWSDFLIVARDWLVAYALVSLLPILISDSRSQILEKYTESLDEALTPLWGRFHFHLKSARDSKSFEQFVWTFSYAKNFVSLLINLSSQLTSTGLLEKLDPGDFKSAALNHISEKAIRFMRAHLAQAIVDASPMTSKECMRLVECSLDFDQSLSLMFLSSLSVSSVLYDARAIHAQWVESDLHFFTSYMADLCSDDSAVFGFRSSFKSMSTSLSIPTVDPLCSAECSGSRCYNGIYDCLYLFSLGLQRYANLPPGSQDIFSKNILEPFLVIAIGLFQFRIRSCPLLFALSTGVLPAQSLSDKIVKSSQLQHTKNKNEISPNFMKIPLPEIVLDFYESVQYFVICLSGITEKSRALKGCVSRYQGQWMRAREDFPDDMVREYESENRYTTKEMVINIMKTNSSESEKEKEKEREKDRIDHGKTDTTIGGVIDYTKAQALKLSSVLDTQWAKLLVTTHTR